MGIAPAKMPQLMDLQADLALPFPLLRDDRSFSAAYGIAEPEEGATVTPSLVLVGRDQKVLWKANPVSSVESVVAELTKVAEADG